MKVVSTVLMAPDLFPVYKPGRSKPYGHCLLMVGAAAMGSQGNGVWCQPVAFHPEDAG